MIEERLRRGSSLRLSHHGDLGRRIIFSPPSPEWVWAFGVHDPAGQPETPSSTSLKWPPRERAPGRAVTREGMLFSVTRRIVAAIRLWRKRVRSRQGLHELSDHLLEDIGLRRVDVGCQFSGACVAVRLSQGSENQGDHPW
jgi:uncharacterized protein YjiS (DUF1127 family)